MGDNGRRLLRGSEELLGHASGQRRVAVQPPNGTEKGETMRKLLVGAMIALAPMTIGGVAFSSAAGASVSIHQEVACSNLAPHVPFLVGHVIGDGCFFNPGPGL